MPQYEVEVRRTLIQRFNQTATVTVEVANEAEARKKAEQLAEQVEDSEIGWDDDHEQDEVEDLDIYEVTEVPPEEEEREEEEE